MGLQGVAACGRRALVVALAVWCSCYGVAHAQEKAPVSPSIGQGYVENLEWRAEERVLTVSGWVAPQSPQVFVTALTLRIGNQVIYQGRFERFERPDVVASTGRDAWLWSGFRVQVHVPENVHGVDLPFSASGRLGSGLSFDLTPSSTSAKLSVAQVHVAGQGARILALLAVLIPLSVLFYFWLVHSQYITHRLQVSIPKLFLMAIMASFLALVAGGWTGSSFGFLFKNHAVANHNIQPWLGKDLLVRSDEWSVLTPLVWAQYQHEPRYPVINQHIGSQGQNMLIVGMTGVPVRHISALAKPATWGFFAGNMRMGLAWDWWFPFFGAFVALWLVMRRFFNVHWCIAAALTLTLTASGYAVGWSGWPMYTLFFALIGMLAVHATTRIHSWGSALGVGFLLGWAVAGFALVLYPAWQISIAYVVLPVVMVWLWGQRKSIPWSAFHLVLGVTALGVAALILGGWWWDAQDAVNAMRSTIYPGGRSTEVGGDIDPWFFMKGWLSPVTMYIHQSSLIIPSDASSIVFLLPALWMAVIRQWWLRRRLDGVSAALLLSTACIMWFMLVGIPAELARWSWLGSTTTYRMDLALGLAQTLLLAWLLSQDRSDRVAAGSSVVWSMVCGVVSGVLMLSAVWQWQLLPVAIAQWIPVGFVAMCCLVIGGSSYAVMTGAYRWALAALVVWTCAASIGFNPLAQAADEVTVVPDLRRNIQPHERVAVAGPTQWAMALQASGVGVVGGVYYYPQNHLWKKLDPQQEKQVVYNRYHLLQMELQSVPASTNYATWVTPRLDAVRLTMDPEHFDFRLLDADLLMAAPSHQTLLDRNPSVRLQASGASWVLYRVQP